MPDANLYLDKIDFDRYLDGDECTRCGSHSCKELVEKMQLPTVPTLTDPRPFTPDLVELNEPTPGAPILVTANSELTQEVILAVMSTTARPFYVMFADTRGDTFDMALILGSFTLERFVKSFADLRVADRAPGSPMLLPGLAANLVGPISEATGCAAELGPVCAAELPLYYGERWGC